MLILAWQVYFSKRIALLLAKITILCNITASRVDKSGI